ncbi:MAG: HAD family hydrolase [Muribaculaceae bacterium]
MELHKDKVDALIFDMDGTLWDAMDSYAEVWNVAFAELGIPLVLTGDDLKDGMGLSIDQILDMLKQRHCIDVDRDRFLARVDEIENEIMPKIGGVPYEGMVEGMQLLAQSYRLFLVSNCGVQGLQNFMRYTGIESYITDFVSYGMRQCGKADNLLYLCDNHKVACAVYVGDTQSDCNSAHAAGMPFVYAAYGFGDCSDYELRCESFAEVVNCFKK